LVYLLEKTWNKNRSIPRLKNLQRGQNERKIIFEIRDYLGRLRS